MTAAGLSVNVTATCPERLARERIEVGELSPLLFLATTPLRSGLRHPLATPPPTRGPRTLLGVGPSHAHP